MFICLLRKDFFIIHIEFPETVVTSLSYGILVNVIAKSIQQKLSKSTVIVLPVIGTNIFTKNRNLKK